MITGLFTFSWASSVRIQILILIVSLVWIEQVEVLDISSEKFLNFAFRTETCFVNHFLKNN